ncbi:MAG: adenine-specific methyltransferase EcoRI family protein [Selenomonadaceae bacterium]|nr:adenine-specific methyltransferase EcoRI family protein [Selenomonadaceae bacterium]
MAKNENLNSAAKNKNDEFYTQFDDIQRELNCYLDYDKNVFRDKTILLPCDDPVYSNFTKFFALNFDFYGLKKLISTSYAPNSKKFIFQPMANLFDEESPVFDASKENSHGKLYTLDRESIKTKPYPVDAVKLDRYLDGDGDFRSKEVSKLRDEADVIITNPPFSLFRQFLKWIMDANKKFLIIGNINCITYSEVFPLIKENKIWLGHGMGRWISGFIVPEGYELYGTEARINKYGERIVATNQCLWLTNLEQGKRHRPITFNTMAENIKFCRHKDVKGKSILYAKYDNYDAIEVPYTDLIPCDYEGVMGVPITFLDKYCPEQFEIVGATESEGKGFSNGLWDSDSTSAQATVNGKKVYKRIFIRHRQK